MPKSPWDHMHPQDPRRPGRTRLPSFLTEQRAGAGETYRTTDGNMTINSFRGGPWSITNSGPGVSRPLRSGEWGEVLDVLRSYGYPKRGRRAEDTVGALIRIAHANPSLQKDLLPIIKKACGKG